MHSPTAVQVYTSSQDGCIILWDFAEGEVAKEYKTGLQVARMVCPACKGACQARHICSNSAGSRISRATLHHLQCTHIESLLL